MIRWLLIVPLIICVTGSVVHNRHRHMPPFLLGRPPGGMLRTSYFQSTGDHLDAADDYPMVEVNYFTQKLDHFDPLNTKTWQQKYYRNPSYYRDTNIIFLMIGGEGPEPKKWAGNGNVTYLKWASKYGAMVFDLEHRFFGDSWPIKSMDTDVLRLCTTEQALQDLAFFIISMNKKHGFSNPKWVTFGGSYPGSLSAFFRAKYPELTVGAVASSAPVNLKLDFYEYAMVVEADVIQSQCDSAIKTAFSQIQKLSLTTDGRNKLNQYFNLQPRFDSGTTKLDITNFFANLYSLFQGMIQYTYDGQSDVTHNDITVKALCKIMNNETEPDVIKRAYNVWLWYNHFYPPQGDPTVFPNSYWDMIASLKGNYTQMDENGAYRGWMWLCCNEIGFLQTTDQGRNIFGANVPLNYFIDMCTDLFGPSVKANFIRDQNKNAQSFYKMASEATNIVLPNGSLDPWHALGTYESNAETHFMPYLINGTAHCADMYPVYDGEPAGLVDARLFIESHLQQMITSVQTSTTHVPSVSTSSLFTPKTTANPEKQSSSTVARSTQQSRAPSKSTSPQPTQSSSPTAPTTSSPPSPAPSKSTSPLPLKSSSPTASTTTAAPPKDTTPLPPQSSSPTAPATAGQSSIAPPKSTSSLPVQSSSHAAPATDGSSSAAPPKDTTPLPAHSSSHTAPASAGPSSIAPPKSTSSLPVQSSTHAAPATDGPSSAAPPKDTTPLPAHSSSHRAPASAGPSSAAPPKSSSTLPVQSSSPTTASPPSVPPPKGTTSLPVQSSTSIAPSTSVEETSTTTKYIPKDDTDKSSFAPQTLFLPLAIGILLL